MDKEAQLNFNKVRKAYSRAKKMVKSMVNTRISPPGVGGVPTSGIKTKLTGRVAHTNKVASVSGGKNPMESNNYGYRSLAEIQEFPIEDGFDKLAAAYLPMMGGAAATVAGTVLGGLALTGIGHGIDQFAAIANKSKYDKALQDAIRMSPSLQMHGYSTLKAYMPMIIKASPTVAEEPKLLANYLESMLDAEGHMNLATFAELSALEGNMLSNADYRNKGTQKFLEGAGKSTMDSLGNAMAANWKENNRRRLF